MMPSRTYNFELPINVPFFYLSTVIGKIVAARLWEELPIRLVNRLADAAHNGTGIEITKADLDTIPDDIWARALKVIG